MGKSWLVKRTDGSVDQCFSEPFGLLAFVMDKDSILYVAETVFYTVCVSKRK